MIDSYGRTVSMATANGLDTYTVNGVSVSLPHGTDPGQALSTLAAMSPVPPAASPEIDPFDFLDLFSPAELVSILSSNDGEVMIASAKVFTIKTYVNLANPETLQLIQYLTYVGILTSDRAAQILAGVPYGQ